MSLGFIWVLAGSATLGAIGSFLINQRLMPVLQRFALARPNARSSHTVPTPQGGGIGVLLACIPAFIASTPPDWPTGSTPWPFAPLAFGAALLAVLGAIDDLRPLPVLPRLAAQILAGALGLISAGATSDTSIIGMPGWLSLPLAGIGLIWFVNLTNFMDGIDGITVAEFMPMLGVLVVLTLLGVFDPGAGLIAAGLFGGLAGFAPFNRHVARLFLGDVGSLAIGLIAGSLLLQLALAGHLAAALILPLYYLADATMTLACRLRRGERITQAHRTHFYQRATDLGWRVPAITRTILVTNFGLGFLSIAAAVTTNIAQHLGLLIAAGALTGWLLRRLSRAPAS